MSEKSKTNKKWTSTEESRANWDRIFGKKPANFCTACGGAAPQQYCKNPECPVQACCGLL